LGESEVLAWANQNSGYEAVLDDRAARNCALSLNIPVRGTIGVLLLARRLGHLKEITPVLQQLEKAGFRLDPTVISAAKKLADED
jgi:predicted nucleic acid-binding protein